MIRRTVTALVLGAALVPVPASAVPTLEVGSVSTATSGAPTSLAISPDGRYIALTERSGGGLSVLDSHAFADGPQTPTVCSSAQAVVHATTATGDSRFYVGCDSGEVQYVDLDGSTVPPTLTVSEVIELNMGAGDVTFLVHAPGDTYVFAAVQNGTSMSLHSINVTADDASTAAAALGLTGTLTITAAAIGSTGGPLVLARTDGYLSFHDRSTATFDTGSLSPALPLGTLDSVAIESTLLTVLVTDATNDEVWSFSTAGSSIGLSWGGGFPDPVAVAWSSELGSAVAWVVTSDSTLYALDSSQSELAAVELVGTPVAVAPVADGPVYVAASDGSLRVISDAPFLYDLAAAPASVGEGDDFTLSFTSTADGSWTVAVGGDGSDASGTELASGDGTADEVIDVALSADDLTVEGDNRLFVRFTGDDDTGVDSTVVTLDTPPEAPDDPAVGAGDERLSVSWMASDEADIDHYELYLSDATFDEAALPTYDVTVDDATVSYPLDITAGEASTDQSASVDGLVNGQTYWVAVRAVDAGGQIGPLSAVVSGQPAATCGAAECANDPGCSCSGSPTPARSSAGLLAGLVLLFGLRLRRRG